VVALGSDGRPDFGALQDRAAGERGGLVFQAFDLLYLDGHSLLGVPLESRKRLLRAVLRETASVRYTSHVPAEGIAFHEAAAARGLEGVIAKHRRSRYEPGRRSSSWLKLKIRPEQELVVGGWTPGEGSARDLGALVVGVQDDGRLRFVGKVGSGFDARARRDLRERLAALASDRPPFDPAPPRDYRGRWGGDLAGVTWVRPELVIRAEIGGWSRDGMVRQSAYKGIDPERDPATVTRERAIETSAAVGATEAELRQPATGRPAERRSEGAASAAAAASAAVAAVGAHLHPWSAGPGELASLDELGTAGTWQVGGFELKLTNLDKILFDGRPGTTAAAAAGTVDPNAVPIEVPVTKRDLIRYFATIAPVLLPHLEERALNLQRFPDGASRAGFWQKDIPRTAPGWLRRWREVGVDARDANEHLVADRVATLCWLGNQAAFEIHAWTSRLDAPWRPTFALIDIDPGERTTWEETLALARLYRTALGHLGVRGYPKTTGKRGIQVWIPVEPRYDYGETSAWVERLSRAVGAVVPDLISWEWSKGSRGGRARLDYTQNAPIKTLVAPYAVRPAAGAPVSAPIAWDELDDPALRPDRWTIRTIVERVAKRGDLFAAAQADPQVLPPI
jgi:DNA ligase D